MQLRFTSLALFIATALAAGVNPNFRSFIDAVNANDKQVQLNLGPQLSGGTSAELPAEADDADSELPPLCQCESDGDGALSDSDVGEFKFVELDATMPCVVVYSDPDDLDCPLATLQCSCDESPEEEEEEEEITYRVFCDSEDVPNCQENSWVRIDTGEAEITQECWEDTGSSEEGYGSGDSYDGNRAPSSTKAFVTMYGKKHETLNIFELLNELCAQGADRDPFECTAHSIDLSISVSIPEERRKDMHLA